MTPIHIDNVNNGATSRTFSYIDSTGHPATVAIQRMDGGPLLNTSYGGITDTVFGIDPAPSATDTVPGSQSGLRFTFSSPVNAFGLDIGDWATCCIDVARDPATVATYNVPTAGSGLWVRFNGGAATLPANALSNADNPGFAATGAYVNFVGAIDDSGTFTTVDFWGDGWGEYLVAGGTLRVGVVSRGGLNPVSVPALGEFGLLGIASLVGAAGAFATRRQRNKQQT